MVEWLKELFPVSSKEPWFWWLAAFIGLLFSGLIYLIVFLGYDKIIKNDMDDLAKSTIPYFARCDGFHGIEGRVMLPKGYKADISNVNIIAIKKGAVVGSDEGCQHKLELNGIFFNQSMKGCASNQELTLSLDSDEYEIRPGTYLVCQSGVDVKLKAKVLPEVSS